MIGPLIELALQLLYAGVQIGGAIHSSSQKNRSQNGTASSNSLATFLAQKESEANHPRAVALVSSSISFGNACERLVNIAFHTSQSFPNMMATCAAVVDYLKKELAKEYPDNLFHIIISESKHFGFSVGDGEYYAEIEQERYRVLIFSTKCHVNIKTDTYCANENMPIKWT